MDIVGRSYLSITPGSLRVKIHDYRDIEQLYNNANTYNILLK